MDSETEPVPPFNAPDEPGDASGVTSRRTGVLSRREVVAMLSAMMVTAACGGDGSPTTPPDPPDPPDPPNPPEPPVKPSGVKDALTTVVLPPGSTLALSTLSVRAMGYPVALSTGATVNVAISPTYPTLALLTGSDGRGVLSAILDPSATDTQTLSARSTAVTLLWFALGGPMLRAELKSAILSQLAADPAVDTLAAVIATRVAASPRAIADGDPAIAGALTTAVNALTAVSVSAFAAAAPTSSRSAYVTAANEPVIFLAPETSQSEVEVRLAPTTAPGVTVSNVGRRGIRVYVYLVQTRTNGVTQDVSPARLIGTPIDLGQPTAYTAVANIRALLALNTPFRGATTSPIPLPLDGASDESFYEIIAIGPSTRATAPAFFAEARYATHVAGWNAAIEELFNRIYYVDILYALVLEIGGFGSLIPDAPGLVLATSNGLQVLPHTTASDVPKIPKGNGPLTSALSAAFLQLEQDPATAEMFYARSPSLMGSVEAAALQLLGRVNWQASYRNAQEFVLKLASPMNNYKPNGTLFKLFDDLARVERGARWNARVARSSVRILPLNPSVSAGEEVGLSVELSPDLTSVYEFEWTNSSATAVLSAVGEANSGRNITTRKLQVTLRANDDEIADITLSVVAYDVANNRRVRVASDSTIVRVIPRVQITPPNLVLNAGQQQTFTVVAPFTPPAGTTYLWNLAGSAGSIGTLNLQTTTVPRIVYTAIRSGSDTLSVQVIDANNRVLGRGSVLVQVDPEEFINITVAGPWDFGRTPPNGVYRYNDHRGIRGPSPGGGAVDALFFGFNFAVDKPGVLVTMLTPQGAPFNSGQSFVKNQEGQDFVIGQFAFTMAVNQNDVAGSSQRAILGTGTLQFTSLARRADNRWVAEYAFSITGPLGGVVSGNGKSSWP